MSVVISITTTNTSAVERPTCQRGGETFAGVAAMTIAATSTTTLPSRTPATSAGVSPATTITADTLTSHQTENEHHHQQQHQNGPPHYVDLHVNTGECVSLQLLDGQEQIIAGPATITMISQQQNPPVPIPVQVSSLA